MMLLNKKCMASNIKILNTKTEETCIIKMTCNKIFLECCKYLLLPFKFNFFEIVNTGKEQTLGCTCQFL